MPLADTWQIMKVVLRFPHLEPVVKAYQKLYPYAGATTSVSVDERADKGIDDDTLTYGETRWTTFMEVLDALNIQPQDRFIDLGCGAGFLCLLASQGYRIPATGVDLIEGFVTRANGLVSQFELKNIDYRQQDFFNMDLSAYSVFYATCTCFPEDYLRRLSAKFRQAPSGSRIATVTYGLDSPWLKQIKVLKCKYSWGMDSVYICERI